MEITPQFVAEVWNHMTGLGIQLTHAEIEESLKCASGEARCANAT